MLSPCIEKWNPLKNVRYVVLLSQPLREHDTRTSYLLAYSNSQDPFTLPPLLPLSATDPTSGPPFQHFQHSETLITAPIGYSFRMSLCLCALLPSVITCVCVCMCEVVCPCVSVSLCVGLSLPLSVSVCLCLCLFLGDYVFLCVWLSVGLCV